MFRAIGRMLRWVWHGLDGLRKVLHLVLLLLLFGAIGAIFSRPIPLVPDRAALVIAPQGPIVEQLSGDPLERALAESLRRLPSETLLRDLVDAIEAGKDDQRISALYLDLGGMGGAGLAKLRDVADAIEAFRESGKPVIAYGDFYDQGQYYLAARADEIYLDPHGIAYVDGFARYGLFVKVPAGEWPRDDLGAGRRRQDRHHAHRDPRGARARARQPLPGAGAAARGDLCLAFGGAEMGAWCERGARLRHARPSAAGAA